MTTGFKRKELVRDLTRVWRYQADVIADLQSAGMSRAAARAAVRYYKRTGTLQVSHRPVKGSVCACLKWRDSGAQEYFVRVDRTQAKVAATDHTSAIRALLHKGIKVIVEDDGQQLVYRVSAQLVDMVRR